MKMKKILQYLSIFVLCICACSYPVYHLNVLFFLPLLAYSFYLGIDCFFVGLLGGGIGIYLYKNEFFYYSFIAIIFLFLCFFILKICRVKVVVNYTFSTIFSTFFTYLLYVILTKEKVFILCFVFLISSILTILFSLTFQKNKPDQEKIITGFLFLFYVGLLPVLEIKIIFSFLVLLLFSAYYSKTMLLSMLCCYLMTMLIFAPETINGYVYIAFPILFIRFLQLNKKYQMILLTDIYILLANIFLHLFSTVSLICIEIGIAFIILILPLDTLLLQPIHNDSFIYQKVKQQVIQQIDQFSLLFYHLGNQFSKAKNTRILEQLNENVLKKLCTNCSKYSICYYKKNHLLLQYIELYLNQSLTEERKKELLKECVHGSAFQLLLENFFKDHLLKEYQNDELYQMKNIVSEQFNAFSLLLKNYKTEIYEDRIYRSENFMHKLKEILKNDNLDFVYFHNLSNYDRYLFALSVHVKDSHKITHLLLPLMQNTLHAKLKIIDVEKKTICADYIQMKIIEDVNFEILHRFSQNCLDKTNCGDYVEASKIDEHFYCILSDGMGFGYNAYEESMFTVNVILNSLKSGLDCKTSIEIMNTLLKLKNHHDTYTTVDLLSINLNTYEACFYKAGASTSFLIRNHQVNEIENYALPIGIIEKINVEPYVFKVQKNDIILMMSDGLVEQYDEKIQMIFQTIEFENIEIMTRELYEKLIKLKQNLDDATLAFILIP